MSSIAINLEPQQRSSQAYTMLGRQNWAAQDLLLFMMNDHLEYQISKLLRDDPTFSHTILQWSRAMAEAMGGYQDWQSILDYTAQALTDTKEDPLDPSSAVVGAEQALIDKLPTSRPDARKRYTESNELEQKTTFGGSSTLSIARERIAILERYRTQLMEDGQDGRLFRKVFYTYKLREALLGQVGYYNGSLELKAGFTDDFEYWMYLIQMQLRKPIRQRRYQAPKSMDAYVTTAASPLPWNNQFSFSYGFDEFEAGNIPAVAAIKIERRLVDMVKSPATQKQLASLLDKKESDLKQEFEALGKVKTPLTQALSAETFPTLNLTSLVAALKHSEVKLKALFTLVLAITWSDEALPKEENAFAIFWDKVLQETDKPTWQRMMEGVRVTSGPKDPRLSKEGTTLDSLVQASYYYNVVGRKANILLEPATVADRFRKKLQRLTLDELKDLYGERITKSTAPEAVAEIVNQAVKAATAWCTRVLQSYKPVYTGPSGHMLTYVNLYLRSLEGKKISGNQPTLHQARLVILAALIGRNQHHSYDEVMTASDGITYQSETLNYMDVAGYKDLNRDTDLHGLWAKIVEAAKAIQQDTLLQIEQQYDTHYVDSLPAEKQADARQEVADMKTAVTNWLTTAVG